MAVCVCVRVCFPHRVPYSDTHVDGMQLIFGDKKEKQLWEAPRPHLGFVSLFLACHTTTTITITTSAATKGDGRRMRFHTLVASPPPFVSTCVTQMCLCGEVINDTLALLAVEKRETAPFHIVDEKK